MKSMLMALVASVVLTTNCLAETGTGQLKQDTPQDFLQPAALYHEATCNLLGTKGYEKSEPKAFQMFLELAEKDYAPAQHMLGSLFERGRGVESSKIMAYKWYARAAQNGFKPSWDKLVVLENQMSAAELANAKDSNLAMSFAP